jgi:hypothetical protein
MKIKKKTENVIFENKKNSILNSNFMSEQHENIKNSIDWNTFIIKVFQSILFYATWRFD